MALDSSETILFDASIVTEQVQAIFGNGFVARPLSIDDYARGHFDLLSVLTQAPDTGKEAYEEQFNALKALPGVYYILAIFRASEPQRMVACGSLILEKKFIRGLATCGHIEDIAVGKDLQGQGIGKKLLQALTLMAENLGCYKVILDCSEENVAFYEKCGYEKHGAQMAKYSTKAKSTPN